MESVKDKSYDELQRLVLEWYENNNYMESPEVKRADHHNPLQSKTIHKYKDIERKSRYVLDKLRYFGLNKIIMKDFHGDSSERPGTIVIKEVVSGANSDIMNGELYFKEGLKSTVDLYFPEDIGKALYNYTDGKLEYEAVSKLKDELCV